MKATLRKQDFYRALETALNIEQEFITETKAISMEVELDSVGVMILLDYSRQRIGCCARRRSVA